MTEFNSNNCQFLFHMSMCQVYHRLEQISTRFPV